MPSDSVEMTGRADAPDALDLALEQSHEVKAKVETCAEDLATANEIVKEQIAGGTTLLSAHETLRAGTTVESKVQECADDLHEVTETLAQGIADLEQTESALTESREVLADTQAALAISRQEEREARRRALHDSMTGLPNRDLFDDRLSHAISIARRHDWTLAVMFLDLDGFKKINDTHGHAAGDAVLKEVARRLSRHSRDEDTVCRNGGDEFLYLLVNPQGMENIERIAGVISANIARPILVDSWQFVVNASMGIAVYPVDGATGDELISSADTAMYRAKKHVSSGCGHRQGREGIGLGLNGARSIFVERPTPVAECGYAAEQTPRRRAPRLIVGGSGWTNAGTGPDMPPPEAIPCRTNRRRNQGHSRRRLVPSVERANASTRVTRAGYRPPAACWRGTKFASNVWAERSGNGYCRFAASAGGDGSRSKQSRPPTARAAALWSTWTSRTGARSEIAGVPP